MLIDWERTINKPKQMIFHNVHLNITTNNYGGSFTFFPTNWKALICDADYARNVYPTIN